MKTISYQSLFAVLPPLPLRAPHVEGPKDALIPKGKTIARDGAIRQRSGFLASSLAPWYEVKYEMWRRPNRRPPTTGDDGDEAIYRYWINHGWPATLFQPGHPRFKNLDDGDEGIKSPMGLFAWGHEPTWALRAPKLRRNLDDGDPGIDLPQPKVIAWGYETVAAITVARPRKNFKDGDPGIDLPLAAAAAATAWGYEAVATLRQRPVTREAATRMRIGFLASSLLPFWPDQQPLAWRQKNRRADVPIDALGVFAPPVAIAWGYEPINFVSPRPLNRRSATKGKTEFGVFASLGPWWEIHSNVWRMPKRLQGMRGEDGVELPFVAPALASVWGYDLPPPFLRRPPGRMLAFPPEWHPPLPRFTPWFEVNFSMWRRPPRRPSMIGDEGDELPFVPTILKGAWFEVNAFSPPHRPLARQISAIRQRVGFLVFPPLTPWFEVHPNTWRRPPRRIGMVGDDGDFSPFSVKPFAPQFDQPFHARLRWRPKPLTWAWNVETGLLNLRLFTEVQPPQPPHPRRERAGSIQPREDGIESPFTPPAATVAWGYEPPIFVRPAPLNRRSATKGKAEFGVFASLGPWFEAASGEMWRRPPRRIGMVGDDGVETRLVAPVFAPQFDQPFHARLRRKPVPLVWPWNVDTSLLNLRPFTEVQSVQPPHRPPPRVGQFLRGDVEAQYPFSIFRPVGWEPNLPILYHRFWHQPEFGDAGAYRPFVPTILGASVCFAGDVALWVTQAEDGSVWVLEALDIAESES